MELQLIQNKIYEIRGHKVMLDYDLAEMFEIRFEELKLAVKENADRFPDDFMFELTEIEFDHVSSLENPKPGELRFVPFAFTEQGVAMLSSVIDSPKAVEISIAIMRGFVQLKQHFTDFRNIKERIVQLEKETNRKFSDIHQALKYLHEKEKEAIEQTRNPIGFKVQKES